MKFNESYFSASRMAGRIAPIRFPRCGSPVGLTPVNDTCAAGSGMCVILLPPVAGTSSGDRSASEDRKTTILATAGQHRCSDGRMYSSVTNLAIGAQMAQSDVAAEPAQRTPSSGTDTIGTVGAAPTTARAAELLTRVSGNAQAG